MTCSKFSVDPSRITETSRTSQEDMADPLSEVSSLLLSSHDPAKRSPARRSPKRQKSRRKTTRASKSSSLYTIWKSPYRHMESEQLGRRPYAQNPRTRSKCTALPPQAHVSLTGRFGVVLMVDGENVATGYCSTN